MKRIALFFSLIALCLVAAVAQGPDRDSQPVKWKFSVRMTGDKTGEVVMTATIGKGWHLYGLKQPQGGPLPTVLDLQSSTGLTFTGNLTADRKAKEENDPLQGMVVNFWENTVTLTRAFRVTDPAKARIKGFVKYMACNGETCMPPVTKDINITVKSKK